MRECTSEARLSLRLLVAPLLLSALAVERVHGLPLDLGKESCPHLQLTRPKTTVTLHWENSWLSKLNLTSLLVVNGADPLFLEQALTAQDGDVGLEDKMCKVTSFPAGDEPSAGPQKGCGTFATAADSGTSYCIKDTNQPLAFVLSEAVLRTLCLYETVMVELSCHLAQKECYKVSFQGADRPALHNTGKVLARSARDAHPSRGVAMFVRPDPKPDGRSAVGPIVGVAVGVVGLAVLVLAVAMCAGGGDKYDPGQGRKASKRMSASDVVAEQTPAPDLTPQPEDNTPELKTNGTGTAAVGAVPTRERDSQKSKSGESVGHHSVSSVREGSERARTLSARSFDPLPEVPKLALAEESRDKTDDDDDEDEDDPYVEVPGEDDERMQESDSDDEEGKPAAGATPFPPYGKVSRHSKPPTDASSKEDKEDNDSYAEVRDVVRRGHFPLPSQRDRSLTDPLNSGNLGATRDKRALTESAASATHMPLPDIPAAGISAQIIVEENEMYDSIPETQTKKASPSSKPKKKERLYETVEEMGEKDLYESVPDSFANMDSPVSPKSLSMPALSPMKVPSEVPPLPPSSPIPTQKNEQGKKKVEKTLSAVAHEEKKRHFSFFRKKTSSVSSRPTKHVPDSPTTTSPQHNPHPLPNIPAPPRPDQSLEDEEEDTTYDKVVPATDPSEQGLSDSTKTKSLPMSYRTGGGRPNLPLPKLPEDSGSGTCTVQHKRVIEGGGGPDEYDTVHLPSQDYTPDEPNYDTVKADDILKLMVRDEAADPPYDKIDKQELQELRERELREREAQRKSLSPSRSRGMTPEGELDPSGLPPDHDEEGYAVVPEEIRMRKRAMSESQGVRALSPTSVAAGYHLVRHDQDHSYDTVREVRSNTVSLSPQTSTGGNVEDQYASINVLTKKDKKQRELEEMLRQQEELKLYTEEATSPPPLPPAPRPEDVEEFKEPPIPAHSEGMHQLLDEGLRNDSGDPPYAKIRNKTTNPYAEVSQVTQPYTEIDVTQLAKARSSSQTAGATPRPSDNVLDEAAGYDVIGTVGVKTKVVQKDKPYDTIENVQAENAFDEAAGYDVIGTVGVKTKVVQKAKDKPYDTIQAEASDNAFDEAAGYDVIGTVGVKTKVIKEDKPYDSVQEAKEEPLSQLEQEMPRLETAESPEGNIYDSLLPENTQNSSEEEYDPKSKSAPRSMV